MVERHLHARGAGAQRLRGPSDLVGRLAFHAQGDEEGAHLRGRGASVEHGINRGPGLVAGQVAPLDRGLDGVAQRHAFTSRKLRSSVCPSGVRIDSGWNWTPKTGSVRCRKAITMPLRVRALTTSCRGIEPASTTKE